EAPKPKRGRAPKAPRKSSSKAKPAPKGRSKAAKSSAKATPADDEVEPVAADDTALEPESPPEPVGPPADHVVHIYEGRKFKRTIVRDFTSEDADKFAAEYNRTSASHNRWAVAGAKDEQPA